MYSVESAVDQNSRSASSSLNVGIFFKRFIRSPLACIHVATCYRSDEPATYREAYKQPALSVCLTQSEVPSLCERVRNIGAERDRMIEEDLLDFPIRDSMLCPVLPNVPVVPVTSFPFGRVELHHDY